MITDRLIEIYCGKMVFLSLTDRRKERRSSGSSTKKIIAYVAIGILALSAVSVAFFARSPTPVDPLEESRKEQLRLFQTLYCASGEGARSTQYVSEIALPTECEMPLGIAADGDKVWYVSTKQGILGSYDRAGKKFEEQKIPSWPARDGPNTFSMSWSVRTDPSGNVWFTDERQKAIWRFDKASEEFEVFYVPASLPAAMEFDADGNLYFIGVMSRSIYFGDISKMKNGTSEGISEIALPLDAFGEIERISTGSLVLDKDNRVIWVSLLAFQQKGVLFRYDIESQKVDRVVELPDTLLSPVGLALDGSNNLWGTDHGTSTFFRYDEANDRLTRFATSLASPNIYGGTTPPNAYTLPYWIQKSPDDGTIWFNEHTGNKIARFDPSTLVLTEYWIPSQNNNWVASCPEGSESCGLANALQFSTGADGQVWFTEWSENKLGRVDVGKPAPISVAADEEVTVARGGSVEIELTLGAETGFNGKMMSSSTLTDTGQLGDSTGVFSEESLSLGAGESKGISYVFSPAESTQIGEQVLMIGAGNDEISVLKAVRVNIV